MGRGILGGYPWVPFRFLLKLALYKPWLGVVWAMNSLVALPSIIIKSVCKRIFQLHPATSILERIFTELVQTMRGL